MRQFLAGLASGAAMLGVGLLLGSRAQDEPPVPGVIRATSIEIVDELGTPRLILGANEHGGAVSVKNTLGHTVLLLGAAEFGGTMVIREQASLAPVVLAGVNELGGELRVQHLEAGVATMKVSRDGARLLLGPPLGEPLAELNTSTGQPGTLVLRNRQGDEAVTVGADESGNGTVETYGPAGRPIVRLASTAADHGLIYTCDRDGNPLVRLTATAEDVGQIYTMNGAGDILIALASQSSGPTIRLFNTNGEAAVTLEPNENGEGEVSVWGSDGNGNTMRPPASNTQTPTTTRSGG